MIAGLFLKSIINLIMHEHGLQNSRSVPSYRIMIKPDFFIWWESLDNFFRDAFPPHFHTAAAGILYQMLFCHESNFFLMFFASENLSTFPKCISLSSKIYFLFIVES